MDAPVLAPFAAIEQMVDTAVISVLANATASWQGGPAFGVIFDSSEGGRFISDAPMTAVRCTVSLCSANCPGIAEGSAGLTVGGKPCRVTSPVVPDAGGWASFTVTFPSGPPAAGCVG